MAFRPLAVLLPLALAACGAPAQSLPREPIPAREAAQAAIERVLARDAAAGKIRDHASETASLEDAVRGYVAALDGLDLTGTPPEFQRALRGHRDAWEGTLPWMSSLPSERGEMHALLRRVEAERPDLAAKGKPLMDRVWSTWAEVERASGGP